MQHTQVNNATYTGYDVEQCEVQCKWESVLEAGLEGDLSHIFVTACPGHHCQQTGLACAGLCGARGAV